MATPFIEASQGAVTAKLGDERIKEALGWLALQSQIEQRKEDQLAKQQKAGAQAFAMMPGLSAPPPPSQGQAPPMTPPNAMAPGAPSQPMQGPPPMGAPGGMSVMPGATQPAAPAPPTAPPGWRPSMAAGPDLGGGGAPPIPGQPQTPAPNADILPPNLLTAQQAIELIQKNPNIPEEMRYPTLQAMLPIMDEQNRLAINKWHATTEAKKAATAAAKERFQEVMAEGKRNLEEYKAADVHALTQAKIKALGQGGGGAGGKETGLEKLYQLKPDGSPDTARGPVGTEGYVNGKLVVKDLQGNTTTREALGAAITPKEGKGSTLNVTNAQRTKLVQGAAKNSLRILDQIEQKYPNDTTSILFSTHPEGLTETAVTGFIRGHQSPRTQEVDTAWKGLIDEAIPVFTGGLRGSDAFRRFLASQAPLMGAKNNAQIIDLFRKNIQGMDRAFANQMMAAYASDPKYWGTRAWDNKPVTREDVDAAMGALQAAPSEGEWKVEKVK